MAWQNWSCGLETTGGCENERCPSQASTASLAGTELTKQKQNWSCVTATFPSLVLEEMA